MERSLYLQTVCSICMAADIAFFVGQFVTDTLQYLPVPLPLLADF